MISSILRHRELTTLPESSKLLYRCNGRKKGAVKRMEVSSQEKREKKNERNGEGGGRKCKVESGRSKHFYITQF